MTPLEAWSVISGNLAQLYKMLKTPCFNGYVPADTEAEVIAFKALQEMQERQYPKPLTVDQLKEMVDEPVWVQPPKMPEHGRWGIVESAGEYDGDKVLWLHNDYTCHYLGKSWVAYKHKPKEANNV